MKSATGRLIVAAVALSLSITSTAVDKLQTLTASHAEVPKAYFGLHIHYADTTTTWPSVSFGSWRLWDTHLQWPWLEPKRGHWNFGRMDKIIELAEQHHEDVLLPLAFSPPWASSRLTEPCVYGYAGCTAPPKDMDDWRNYVRTIATRYKGKVHGYEIWNEPNLKDFWTGDTDQLVALTREAYRILKQVDAANIVVSPSATGEPGLKWLDDFLADGGGKYVDVIGYHFYVTPQPPETMVSRIQAVEGLMAKYGIQNKPLWNTETGWLIASRRSEVKPRKGSFSRVLSEDEASSYIARSYALAWPAGVSRLFWYAWDNADMGMTEKDGRTVKSPLAKAYEQMERWTVGATFSACTELTGGTWVCSLSRPNGYKAQIVWNENKSVAFPLAQLPDYKYAEDLRGEVTPLNGKSSLPAGNAPILIETSRTTE